MSNILIAGGGDEGYQISRSVRLRSSATAYFNRTPASAGSLTTWTWSAWVKRGAISSSTIYALFSGGTGTAATTNWIGFVNDSLGFSVADGTYYLLSTAVFRDPSAWYHVVAVYDSGNATSSNRMKLYVNGVQITAFSTATYPTLSYAGYINGANGNYLGLRAAYSDKYFDGYLTEVNFIDGQALTPSSFGETDAITGVWKPKKYAGTYGTNGFYLNFSDNSAATAAAIGKDSSGNGNNWTPNNISVIAGATYDSMLDTPTPYADGGNGRGNYCTLNPLTANASNVTYSDGNLGYTSAVASSFVTTYGTIAITSGMKVYIEVTCVAAATYRNFGVYDLVNGTGSAAYSGDTGAVTGGTSVSGTTATWTTNDILGMACDYNAGTVAFYKNNTLIATASGVLNTLPWHFNCAQAVGSQGKYAINFGQRPFTYTPPTGFKALNTQNLPDATITKGNKNFDATTYTGNGTTQTVTNSGGFQPDLVWYKNRSIVASHNLFDSIRGVNQYLISDSTGAEGTASGVTAFNSNGFSVGSLSNGNGNGNAIVAWQWKAGGTAVSNTAGSITSQVSANTTAGFSVVTYTGTGANATVGHGLGVAPKMVIVKNRTAGSTDWCVYHTSLTSAAYALFLESTQAQGSYPTVWNSTAPASSVFSVGSNLSTNGSTNTFVAYCFAEVAGYSKFGSYTGNGSADGPFVYCGFRPRYVMRKRTDSATDGSWIIYDTSRIVYNANNLVLFGESSAAEVTGAPIDILSNGFKLRDSAAGNTSGGTYIFAAFAENPFRNALAR